VRSKSVNTIAKLRKSPNCVHSITAVTGELKSDFIDHIWLPKKIMELSRKNPEWELAQITEAAWGYREHPETGDTITSSLFGTEAHNCMEQMLKHLQEGSDYHDPYLPLCRPFIEHIQEECIDPVFMELMVIDDERRVGGTIDFVAVKDGKYQVYDFKFRGNNNAYDKDMLQLAFASDVVRKQLKLKYYPEIFSVVIDYTSGNIKVREWAEADKIEGVQIFEALNKVHIWKNKLYK